MQKLVILAFVLSLSGQAHASDFEDHIKICSSIAGITQNALQEMESRKIPLEKTQMFREVGHDQNMAKTLRDAVNVRRRGASISQITDAWAQGCVEALGKAR
ncbi:MAG: hypothetical protein PHV02_07260 [Rhodocyclaceae bacterium]|nr:hypothetical protein [Rhodocyclaceae bacterium]